MSMRRLIEAVEGKAPNTRSLAKADSAPTTYYRGGGDSMESVDRNTTVWDMVRFEQDALGNQETVIPLFPAEVLKMIPARQTRWLARQRKIAQTYGRQIDKFVYREPVELVKDNQGGYVVIERKGFDFYTQGKT
jgi:hypothetical protein